MDQLRPLAIAAGAVSLAVSLFALGAAVTSDENDGGGGEASPATTAVAETAPASESPGTGGSDTTAPAGSEAAAGERVDVEIASFQFGDGEPVTVPVGAEVVWTNNDSMDHTVEFTDGSGIPTSPNLAEGDTYSFTFTEPGTYDYICGIHPRMTGTIVVEG